MVVVSLLNGLREGDEIEDVQTRLKELPPDLEDLFQYILRKLNTRYKRQKSENFQIFREEIRLIDRPFKILDMCFAEVGIEASLST